MDSTKITVKKQNFPEIKGWWSTLTAALPISCLSISLIAFGWFQFKTSEAEYWVQHTQNVKLEVTKLLNALVDGETGVRGYYLTNLPQFLRPYKKGISIIPTALQQLHKYVNYNPTQARQLGVIETCVNKRITLLQSNFLKNSSQNQKGNTLALLKKGIVEEKVVMDQCRQEIDQFLNEEERLLTERKQILEQERETTWAILIISAIVGVLGSSIALFLLKRTDDKLRSQMLESRSNEQRFQDTFEQAAVGIAHIGFNGKFLRLNQKFSDIVGYSRAELAQMTFQDITYPEDLNLDLNNYEQLLAEKITSYSLEKRYCCKNGQLIWVNLTVSLANDSIDLEDPELPNNPTKNEYAIAVIEDITNRKLIEEERNRFFDFSLDIIAISTQAGSFKQINPAATKILGYSCEELLASNWMDLLHPDDLALSLAEAEKILSGIPTLNFENRFRCKDGTYKWIAWTAVSSGPNIYNIGRDISDRKQTEAKLEREHRQLQQIITNAPVAMAMFNREMCYIAYSDKWLTDFGLVGADAPTSLLGQNHNTIFPQMPDEWKSAYQRSLKGEILSSPEDQMQNPDGTKTYIRWAIHPWYEPNGEVGGIVIAADRIDELVKAREAALENSRLKSQFLANMSHEIRTPMNGVLGMAGLLFKTALTQKQRDFVQAIRISGDHLLSIINDILDFSKLEAGEMQLETLDFELNNCLETVVDLLAAQAEDKGLEMAVLINPEVPRYLQGDPGRLRQVLLNLMGNALKFTAIGEVVLRVYLQSTTKKTVLLRFEVSDTGIGIPIEAQQKLFQAFSQVDASTTRQYGGTGLGLVISKQLVHLMGGEIGVKSSAEVGSTFWFTVKFNQPKDANATALPTSLMDLKLLVADSSATVRQAVYYLTQSWGMHLDQVADGESALTKLRLAIGQNQPYDAVIFDQQLLRYQGLDFTLAIRSDPALADTKLILMTSINQRDMAEELLKTGVSSYLIKPVRASRLFDALLTAMANRIVSVLESRRESSDYQLTGAVTRNNLKILLAEDHPINQQVILNQLSLLGYEADLANNGQEVLDLFRQNHYDLIFMDCQMPLLDGYETTKIIRQKEAALNRKSSHNIVIIALTAHAMPADREKCLAAGMDDYLSKPLDQEQLQVALVRWSEKIQGKKGLTIQSSQENQESAQSCSTMVKPVDLQRLHAISGGQIEFQRKLLRAFADRVIIDLAGLREAIATQNFSELEQQAHRVKGASANVGATQLSAIAAQLENFGRQQNLTDSTQILLLLEEQLQQVNSFIQHY